MLSEMMNVLGFDLQLFLNNAFQFVKCQFGYDHLCKIASVCDISDSGSQPCIPNGYYFHQKIYNYVQSLKLLDKVFA